MAEGWVYVSARETGVKDFSGTTQEATQAVELCQVSFRFLEGFQQVGKPPVDMVSYEYDSEEIEVYHPTSGKHSLSVEASELDNLETLFCTKVAPFLVGIYA